MRRICSAVFVIGAAALAATTAMVASRAENAPVKIGVVLPLTGPSAAIGQENLKGIQLAFDQENNAIAGTPIQLVTADDQNSPNVGLTETRRLVENEKVAAVAGTLNSAVALAIHAFTSRNKVPYISGGIVRDLTDSKKSPYTFRGSVAASQLEGVIAQFLVQNGWPHVILMGSDYAAGHDAVAAVGAAVKRLDGTVVAEVFPRAGETDYSPYFSRLADQSADAVYGFFFGGDVLRFVRQYKSSGLKFPLIMTDVALSAGGVSEALGKDIDGVYSVEYWINALTDPTIKSLHRRLHGEVRQQTGRDRLLRLRRGTHPRGSAQSAQRKGREWRRTRRCHAQGQIRRPRRHISVRRQQQPDCPWLFRSMGLGRHQANGDSAQVDCRHHAGLGTVEMTTKSSLSLFCHTRTAFRGDAANVG